MRSIFTINHRKDNFMANTIEIELRYEIVDKKQLEPFLSCAQLLSKKHDVDVYWDTPERILWQRGIFVRTRNDKKLDIKFNRACLNDVTIERLDYCEEHSFQLPLTADNLPKLNPLLVSLNLKEISHAALDSLVATNNFNVHYVIDKVRTSYKYQEFTVAIDEVADLGTFLEIELMTQNASDLENIKNDMKTALAGLQLKPLRLGYCSMILKKHQYDCYRQGRYAAPEDKHPSQCHEV